MKKKLLTVLLLILSYLFVAIPFKVMVVIPGFTDIRPVTILEPIFGLFFGIPGCIIYSIMNLVMDVVGDSLKISSVAGLAANFIGPYFVFMFWRHMKKKGKELTFRTPKNVLLFAFSILCSAILATLIITPFVVISYPEVNAFNLALTIMCNETIFPICFGIPVLIVMKEEMGWEFIF